MMFFKSDFSGLVCFAVISVLQQVLLAPLDARNEMVDLALYEGNLRSLLLLGTGRNRPGCWRHRGDNTVKEGLSIPLCV